jgi:Tfp pilus assembly protein PilV
MMKKTTKGFSLIETVISLFIVLLGLLFIAKIIALSLDMGRRSLYRFRLQQKHEYYQNLLLASSFQSAELSEGDHSRAEEDFSIHWAINDIETGLKKIELMTSYKGFKQRSDLYKSKFIKEVKNE